MTLRRFFPRAILLITSLALSLSAQSAIAQETKAEDRQEIKTPMRVAFVDIERVSEEATFFLKMVQGIEGDLKNRQDLIEKKKKEYATLRDELRRKESVLSDEQVEEMRKKLNTLRSEIEDEQYEINRLLRESERKQMAPAMERMLKTIKEVAEEEKIDLVVRNEIVLHAEPWADITDKVIEALNAEEKAGSERRPAVSDE
ncbi:MAG: OmpH family outer membrane protein [Candidatus Sumerlaeota bacterium]